MVHIEFFMKYKNIKKMYFLDTRFLKPRHECHSNSNLYNKH